MEKYGLLFESIFKRKLTDDNTVGYLENLAKEHPYFSVAQFYLLQLSQKDTNGYKVQVKKTAALFNNNHWLNFQLLEAGYADEQETDAAITAITENFTGNISNVHSTTAATEQNEVSLNEQPVNAIETISAEPFIENLVNEIHSEDKPEAIEPTEPVENLQGGSNDLPETVTEKEAAIAVEKETVVIDTIEEKSLVTETVTPVEDSAEALHNEPAAEEIKEVVEVKPIETIVEAAPENEPLLFEPLHTTDYFASVGIKLSDEEKSSDKLGRQLKSFTDWLKTMKKVHAQQLGQTTQPAEVEAAGTESIQKMAEKSNQENDVITEAMAEVLLQQGRQDKAIEILEKLSLLNPSKSAYFASKINQIKEK